MILILSFLNVWLSLMCRKVRQGKARRRVSHYNTTFPAVFAIFETFVSMLSGIIIQCSSSSTSTLRRYPFIVIMVIWSFMLCYVGWGKIKCHSTRAHILMNRTSNELSVSASYTLENLFEFTQIVKENAYSWFLLLLLLQFPNFESE